MNVMAVQVLAAWLAMAKAHAPRTGRSASAMTAGTVTPVNCHTALASPTATIMVCVFCLCIYIFFDRAVLCSVRSLLLERVSGDEVAWVVNSIVCDSEWAVWESVKTARGCG